MIAEDWLQNSDGYHLFPTLTEDLPTQGQSRT